MWTTVYIAGDKDIAENIKEALTMQGVAFKIREVGEADGICYEFLVPDAEVEQAHGIIIDIGF